MRKIVTTLLAAGALVYLTATITLRGLAAAAEAAGVIGGFSLVLTTLGVLRQRAEPPAPRPCPGDAAGLGYFPGLGGHALEAAQGASCAGARPAWPVLPLGWLVLDADGGRPMLGGAIRELRELCDGLGGRLPEGMVLVLFALPGGHAPPGRLVLTFGIGLAPAPCGP
ncbi:hypothetical protein [Nonomuraea sp. NPDC023979]|uniref:hypothetical protein n=1 Tax=Nonomuraea sp. NPDC023979 TaxID=3154796 RepID=UPI0033D60391